MDAQALGQQLRAAREARELTLEEVEQTLRIRARFLAAFEAGTYENLPGLVQARGFLRNYARFLKLDEDAILAQFDAAVQASGGLSWRQPAPSQPVLLQEVPLEGGALLPEEGGGQGRRIGVVLGAVVGLVLIAGLCFGGTQLIERLLIEQAAVEGPELLSILPTVPSLTPSATFLPTATPASGLPVVADGQPITDRVVVSINVVGRSWTRITADGVVVFEGLLRPGTTVQYQAQQVLDIQASNGAGLDVVFNNLPIGRLGLRGEAVDTTFTPDLVLTPTPDEAPTATFTPIPSPTIEGTAGEEGPTSLPVPGAGEAGTGEEGVPSPTPLPIPGAATEELLPSASPTATLPPSQPPTATATPTATPTNTVTPSPTVSPSPTAILPPRYTSTPIPQKQG